jgi:hypothetical protein
LKKAKEFYKMSANDSDIVMHGIDNVPGSNAQTTMASGPPDEIQATELSSSPEKNKSSDKFVIDTIQSLSQSSSGLSTPNEIEKYLSSNSIDTDTTASLNQSKSSLTCCTFDDTILSASSVNDSNWLGLTPKGQAVKSWNELSISPTKLTTVDEARLKIQEDGIDKLDFYQNGKQAIKRAVLFLYGVGYGASKEKGLRIEGIRRLVSKKNRRRLFDFAFEGYLNQQSVRDKAEPFLKMAVVLKHYFSEDAYDSEEKFGKFPGEPFVRYQRGSNENCYEPASSVWASLVIRHQDSDVGENYVVDAGQRTRRYMLYDKEKIDKRIEDRVIDNAGGYTWEYASLIVDAKKLLLECFADDSIWQCGSFMEVNGERFIALVNKYGPGLITNFFVTFKFKEAAGRKNSGCGYWMFDGDSIDVEGKWVSCDDDVEYRNSLSTIVDQEITKAEEKYRELRLLMNELFTSSENNEKKRVSENTSGGGSVPQHAMVLLGGRKFSEGKKTKIYFICQNSWPNMELVVCSRTYLEACQAQVLFRVADIGLELRNDLATSPNLIVDCASPYSRLEDVNDKTNLALLFANDTPSPVLPDIGNPFNDSFDSDDSDY